MPQRWVSTEVLAAASPFRPMLLFVLECSCRAAARCVELSKAARCSCALARKSPRHLKDGLAICRFSPCEGGGNPDRFRLAGPVASLDSQGLITTHANLETDSFGALQLGQLPYVRGTEAVALRFAAALGERSTSQSLKRQFRASFAESEH